MSEVSYQSSAQQSPGQGSKVTATDVARACGVSQMTVSRVFSGSSAVSENTRQRIKQVASELGYRPNVAARAMRGGRTKTIALLGGSVVTPIATYKMKAIEQAARKSGYVCYISNMPWGDARGMKLAVEDLVARSVDGFIAYVGSPEQQATISSLVDGRTPIVHLDNAPKQARFYVDINRSAGMQQAAKYLASLGHKKVRFVSTSSDVYDPSLKADLYSKALKKVGIELLSPWKYSIDPQRQVSDSAYELVERMIQANDLPTALLMSNDEAALSALAALADNGIKVPEQISVVGFDDLPQAKYCRPALTTIHQPREEAGAAAFEMLQRIMEDDHTENNIEPMQQTFDCKLVVRQSTGPANET